MNEHYPFAAAPLPYPYDALEPYISAETLHFHHDKHLQAYVDNLNKALKGAPEYQDWSLKALLVYYDGFPEPLRTQVRNNGGGIYSHELYFDCMGPLRDTVPGGNLGQKLLSQFGSYEAFKQQFTQAGMNQFGSGWAWLTFDARCTFQIIPTPNQDVPLPSLFHPLLPLDVWEHAYYLQYQNRRAEYIQNWFHVVDWNKVENLYSCG